MENENRKIKFLKTYCFNKIFNAPYEIINDPINKLFFEFNEVENIISLKNPKVIKFLYFNKYTINII